MNYRVKYLIKSDYLRYKGNCNWQNIIKEFFMNKSFRFSTLIRICKLYEHQKYKCFFFRIIKKIIFFNFNTIEIPYTLTIGKGLYLGHFYGITINPMAIIGDNVNIHKGVTIGQENRGKRLGAPKIGNKVWIGINSTIVGNITIGNNVLIAPNSFVNFNVPSDSIVVGNSIKPCKSATEGYIVNIV